MKNKKVIETLFLFVVLCFFIQWFNSFTLKNKLKSHSSQSNITVSKNATRFTDIKITTETPENQNLYKAGLSDDTKLEIINIHNNLRNKIALQESHLGKNNFPYAKNMRQVYWSESLAKKAQIWADRCEFEHSPNDFRKMAKVAADLGENIAMIVANSTIDMKWEHIILSWFKEIENYDIINYPISSFDIQPRVVGHFTQIIWGDTYLIGCGIALFSKNGIVNYLYVCEYAPQGNIIDMPIYIAGNNKDERNCPEGTSAINKEYPGLCCIDGKCEKKLYQMN